MVNKIDLLHDGEFIELIENSSSTAEVLKTLGYSVKGNSWAYKIVSERMNKLNVHFGKKLVINSQGKQEKLPLEKILTTDSEYNRTKLKDRLVQEGLKEYKCECCGITEWMGNPISLQLHHLNGIHNDNFLKNQHLYFSALQYYYQNGFTYIELGDGDELWENRKMEQIEEVHGEVFELLAQFYQKRRLYMIYGNHDIVKKGNSFSQKKILYWA